MRMPQDVTRDLRYAVRALVAAPTFAVVAILTLGLGVGANTAIFSVINGLLLQPLPYPEPERLLFVDGALTRPEGEVSFQLSYPDVRDIVTQSRTIAEAAPWTNNWGLAVEGTDGAQRLEANFVGHGYFAILGGTPLMGRTFTAADHVLGGDGTLVAIVSEGTWRQQLGADPAIVGREVRLQNRVFTVVGVMPASFHDAAAGQGARIDVWAPLERAPATFGQPNLSARGSRLLWVVARLAPGATVASAQAELATISAQIAAADPVNTNFSYKAAALDRTFFADARRPLWMLLAGSVFVLLIGCVNVANLLLLRSTARARDIAVRFAIGASRGRIVQQLLIESTVLALAGGLAGITLAMWLTPVLVRLSGIDLPAFARVTVDGVVLSAALLTSLGCGLLFGLAPVWRTTRVSVRDTIATSGSGRVASSSATARLLAGLEVTAAFVLAASALLMLQSFSALTRTDLAFRADRLLTVRLELPQDRYATPALRAQAGQQLLDRLHALPGVAQAMIWGPSMFARSTWVAFLSPADQLTKDDERLMVWRHSTNPGALGDLGVRLVAGRDFNHRDTLAAPFVGIVSEATAARLWPGQDPVGRQVRSGSGATASTTTIVGVAADARHRGRFRFSEGAAAYEPQLDIYYPFAQRPNSLVTFGVRTHSEAGGLTSAVRAAIAGFDPAVPVYDVESLENRMRTEESPVAFAALLLNIYGGLAILLAGVGVYGVLASGVASRRREFGIRSALGANPRRLLGGVVAEGLTVSVVAIVIGLVATSALTRVLGGMVFGVEPGNVLPLSVAAAILVALSVVASLIPAMRASQVDPVQVLRIE